jgi:hypothetical protein
MTDRKVKQVLSVAGPNGRGGYEERVNEGEYKRNIMYSCMKMEQGELLKLS